MPQTSLAPNIFTLSHLFSHLFFNTTIWPRTSNLHYCPTLLWLSLQLVVNGDLINGVAGVVKRLRDRDGHGSAETMLEETDI